MELIYTVLGVLVTFAVVWLSIKTIYDTFKFKRAQQIAQIEAMIEARKAEKVTSNIIDYGHYVAKYNKETRRWEKWN